MQRMIGERLGFGVTEAGKMVLRGTAFVALAALIIPVFGVLSALIAVVLTALVLGFLLRPRIRISGRPPERVVAGQAAQFAYMLENTASLPAYNLRVRFPRLPAGFEQIAGDGLVARLAPGERTEVTVTVRPVRRGHYRIGQPACLSGFPFNLFQFGSSRRGTEEPLIVLPPFSRLHVPIRHLSQPVHLSGAKVAGRFGMSPEYIGNRPFLPGDSPRRIDARAWARLSVPATKEYDDNVDSHAAVMLDTRVGHLPARRPSGDIRELEAAVSLCASVAFSVNRECLVDVLLIGADVHDFSGWPRAARLDKIHEILAGVAPARGHAVDTLLPTLADRFREMSEIVFILLRWDESYGQMVALASRAGCHCTVALVGDDETERSEDVRRWADRVRVVDADEILTGRLQRL
jgi:uncharacterized protein (DUF58 family)